MANWQLRQAREHAKRWRTKARQMEFECFAARSELRETKNRMWKWREDCDLWRERFSRLQAFVILPIPLALMDFENIKGEWIVD